MIELDMEMEQLCNLCGGRGWYYQIGLARPSSVSLSSSKVICEVCSGTGKVLLEELELE